MTARDAQPLGRFTKTTRRHFLQTTSAAAAAATLAGTMVNRAHAAGSEELKIAVVGCGGRGNGAVTQALNTAGPVKLWAMADAFEDRINSALRGLIEGQGGNYDRDAHSGFRGKIEVPPERRFVGFDAYRHAIDSGVDVVLLATSPFFRPEHFEYAVSKGVHVFMEKPVGTDAPGIRRLLAAAKVAREKNVKVAAGLQRRHDARYQGTIARLKEGVLGRIIMLRANWNGGFMWKVARTPEMTEMEYQMRNWQYFHWLSGDHNVEQHIHNLDVIHWLMDKPPVEAQGMGGRQVRKGPEHGDIFDHHFVEYTYDDGVKLFAQCRQISGTASNVSEHVHGEKAYSDVGAGVIRPVDGPEWRWQGERKNPYQVTHDLLFDAIRNDKPLMEAEHAGISTMMAIMGRMATYSGKVVRWDEALNSQLSLAPMKYAMDADPPTVPRADGEYPVAVPGVTQAW